MGSGWPCFLCLWGAAECRCNTVTPINLDYNATCRASVAGAHAHPGHLTACSNDTTTTIPSKHLNWGTIQSLQCVALLFDAESQSFTRCCVRTLRPLNKPSAPHFNLVPHTHHLALSSLYPSGTQPKIPSPP